MKKSGHNRDSLSEALLEDYLESHKEAVEAIKTQITDPFQRVDALCKLSQALDRTFRSLDKTNPEHAPLRVAQTVLQHQADFIKHRFPNHLPAFLEILEPFGREIAQSLGK